MFGVDLDGGVPLPLPVPVTARILPDLSMPGVLAESCHHSLASAVTGCAGIAGSRAADCPATNVKGRSSIASVSSKSTGERLLAAGAARRAFTASYSPLNCCTAAYLD